MRPADDSTSAVPRAGSSSVNWAEYGIEAALLAGFMLSACSFGVLLEHPDAWVRHLLPDPFARRALMGVAMGLTAMALIYSPWGGRSGAHFNPAITFTFWRLGRIRGPDALGYVAGQFAGGIVGVALARFIWGSRLAAPETNYVATLPGRWGSGVAFAAEVLISAGVMAWVVGSVGTRWVRWTGLGAGALVALYIAFEAPFSGMSMNPARSLASAWAAGTWMPLWIYFVAPPLGMRLGAVLATWLRAVPGCPKLSHPASQPCIFCGHPGR